MSSPVLVLALLRLAQGENPCSVRSSSTTQTSPTQETTYLKVAEGQDTSWTIHPDEYAAGYANGHSSKYSIGDAKQKCIEDGDSCRAVTCSAPPVSSDPDMYLKNQMAMTEASEDLNQYNLDSNQRYFEAAQHVNSGLAKMLFDVSTLVPELESKMLQNEQLFQSSQDSAPLLEEDTSIPLEAASSASIQRSKQAVKDMAEFERSYLLQVGVIDETKFQAPFLTLKNEKQSDSDAAAAASADFESKALSKLQTTSILAASNVRKGEIDFKKRAKTAEIKMDTNMQHVEKSMGDLELVADDGAADEDRWADENEHIVSSANDDAPGLELQQEKAAVHLEDAQEEGDDIVDKMEDDTDYELEDLEEDMEEKHDDNALLTEEDLESALESFELKRDELQKTVDEKAGALGPQHLLIEKQIARSQVALADLDAKLTSTKAAIALHKGVVDKGIKSYIKDIRGHIDKVKAVGEKLTTATEDNALKENKRAVHRINADMVGKIGEKEREQLAKVAGARDVFNTGVANTETSLKANNEALVQLDSTIAGLAKGVRDNVRSSKELANLKVGTIIAQQAAHLEHTKSTSSVVSAKSKALLAVSVAMLEASKGLDGDAKTVLEYVKLVSDKHSKDISQTGLTQLQNLEDWGKTTRERISAHTAQATQALALIANKEAEAAQVLASIQELRAFSSSVDENAPGNVLAEIDHLQELVKDTFNTEAQTHTTAQIAAGTARGKAHVEEADGIVTAETTAVTHRTKAAIAEIESEAESAEGMRALASATAAQHDQILTEKVAATDKRINGENGDGGLIAEMDAAQKHIKDEIAGSLEDTRSLVQQISGIWSTFIGQMEDVVNDIDFDGRAAETNVLTEFKQTINQNNGAMSIEAKSASSEVMKVKAQNKILFESALRKADKQTFAAESKVSKLQELAANTGGADAIAAAFMHMEEQRRAAAALTSAASSAEDNMDKLMGGVMSQLDHEKSLGSDAVDHLKNLVEQALNGAGAEQAAAQKALRMFLAGAKQNVEHTFGEEQKTIGDLQGHLEETERHVHGDEGAAMAQLSHETQHALDTFNGDKVELIRQLAEAESATRASFAMTQEVQTNVANNEHLANQENHQKQREIETLMNAINPAAKVAELEAAEKGVAGAAQAAHAEETAAAAAVEAKAYKLANLVSGVIRNSYNQVGKLHGRAEDVADAVHDKLNEVEGLQRESAMGVGNVIGDITKVAAYMQKGFHDKKLHYQGRVDKGRTIINQLKSMGQYGDSATVQTVFDDMILADKESKDLIDRTATADASTNTLRAKLNNVLASMGLLIDMDDVDDQANGLVEAHKKAHEDMLQARADMEIEIRNATRDAEKAMQVIFDKQQSQIAGISALTHLTQEQRDTMLAEVHASAEKARTEVMAKTRHLINSQAQMKEKVLRGERTVEELREQAKRLATGPPRYGEDLRSLRNKVDEGLSTTREKYILAPSSLLEEGARVDAGTSQQAQQEVIAARAFRTVTSKLRIMAAKKQQREVHWEKALASLMSV